MSGETSNQSGKVCFNPIAWFGNHDLCTRLGLGLRKHDICFLITVKPTRAIGTPLNSDAGFIEQTGLTAVRGCEIEGMLDERGQLIDERKFGIAGWLDLDYTWNRGGSIIALSKQGLL